MTVRSWPKAVLREQPFSTITDYSAYPHIVGTKVIYSKLINPSLSDLVAEGTLGRFFQTTHMTSF
jgi:hypothetical protein